MQESISSLPEIGEAGKSTPRYVELQGSMSISLNMSATVQLDFLNAVKSMVDTVETVVPSEETAESIKSIRTDIENLNGKRLTLKNALSLISKVVAFGSNAVTILEYLEDSDLFGALGPSVRQIIQKLAEHGTNIQSVRSDEEFTIGLAELTKCIKAFYEFIKLFYNGK